MKLREYFSYEYSEVLKGFCLQPKYARVFLARNNKMHQRCYATCLWYCPFLQPVLSYQ